MKWLIEFRFPEGVCYSGEYQDGKQIGLGFAPTKRTAKRYESAEIAGRFAANHYRGMSKEAFIVPDYEDEEDGA